MVKKCHFLTILQGWHFDELCPALSMIKVVLYREVKKVNQIGLVFCYQNCSDLL